VAYFEWDAGHRRNEALDCRVYALAALRILVQHRGLKLGKLKPRKDKIEEREGVIQDPKQEFRNHKAKPSSKKQNNRWAGYEGKW
jgi:phage terminase large subunit GpA-like protein